jgi:SPP1 gp7 family putative phage head morphogenesis protein
MPIKPLPLVVQVMLGFKAALLAGEIAQIEEMSLRWLQMEASLRDSFDALALDLDRLKRDGQEISVSKLIRNERYRRLLAQMTQQLDFYSSYAEGRIRVGQLEMIRLGIEHAVEAIKAYFVTRGRVAGAFDILPIAAIQNMVGLAGDGSPLRQLLQDSWPSAVEGLTTKLINAIALGKNPNDTARAMRDGFGVGFHRAINIARTEQLRVYRTAAVEEYKTSQLVSGYKRLSARDTRVCVACLMADDGTVYDLDVVFEEHPQGRCTTVPVVIGLPVVTWQTGQSWFLAQTPDAQRSMLGAGRFDAWQNGEFELADLVRRTENEIWGTSLRTATLKELIE